MKRLVMVGMMAGALAMFATKAEALSLTVTACQGAAIPANCSTFVIPNGGATGFFTVGDYRVSVTGSATNGGPTAISADASTSVQRVTANSATALDIWYIVEGYTAPTGPSYNLDVALGASATGAQRDLVSYMAWYSSTNSTAINPPTGSASLLASCTPTFGGSDSCSSNPGPTPVAPGSNLFSIISRATFALALTDVSEYGFTGRASLTAVPEPGSMILLGTGLLGMAGLVRRRIKK